MKTIGNNFNFQATNTALFTPYSSHLTLHTLHLTHGIIMKSFHSHLPPCFVLQIIILSIPGMALASFLTAIMGMYVFGYGWSWYVALLFGTIISSTDPVAVIAVLNSLGKSNLNRTYNNVLTPPFKTTPTYWDIAWVIWGLSDKISIVYSNEDRFLPDCG